ncbi:MAG: helix-turn-helix domain-containing protein [Oscillospiraceae bacterium]|nr:helix-turn-helix domain-containing protein [Oscillospiraceae bacterium]
MIIPKEIYSSPLSGKAVCVFVYLCDKANKNGTCYPAVRTVANDLHISKSTVFRALKELEDAGLLTRQHRHRTHGGMSSNLYRIGGDTNA